MTNEELLAAIRAIIKEELILMNTAPSDDEIVEGPDEDGRVKFLGTERENPAVKVLSVLTVKKAASGEIAPLTEKQMATLMMNCGCDERGNLQPIFGRDYGQTGNPVIDETTYMANKVVKKATFWQPNRYVLGEAFAQSDLDRTISSRSEKIATLVASVKGLGKLHENDGSAFTG